MIILAYVPFTTGYEVRLAVIFLFSTSFIFLRIFLWGDFYNFSLELTEFVLRELREQQILAFATKYHQMTMMFQK